MARHTFATTVTLTQGVPLETVSKMLGHKRITTTQIYAQITNDKIGQDMAALSGETRQCLQGRAVSRANRPQPIQKIQKLEIRRIVIEFTYNLTYAIPTYNRINTKDCNMARKFVKAGLHAETLRFGYLR